MNTKFTIYTERVNVSAIRAEVGVYFDSFTTEDITGHWRGYDEPSLRIELISDVSKASEVYTIAANIKELNQQDSVLVVQENVIARTI